MIQANCRARFTAQDFEFVIRVLGRDSRQKISLVDLLTDPESRDQILDDESLYRAVLENTGNLTISPQFYFYVLARLVLRRAGIARTRGCRRYLRVHWPASDRNQVPAGADFTISPA